MFSTGDTVKFHTSDTDMAIGTITRVWDKPAADPYVTVKTLDSRASTFVRCSSRVTLICSAAQRRADQITVRQDQMMGH